MNTLKVFYYSIRRAAFIAAAVFFAPLLRARAATRTRPWGDAPRILVIPQFTRIGDLVCATPMFRLIKKHYPKSHLAVLVAPRTVPIIKNNPRVDEIISLKSIDFAKRVLPEIRAKKFDVSFNLSASAVGTIVSLFGLVPKRVKLTRRPRPFSEFFTDCLNTDFCRYEHHTYLPQYYLKMLESIGIKDREEIKEMFPTKAGDEKAAAFLRDRGVSENDLLMGISIAANNKIKEWGDKKFLEVAKYVREKYGAKVAFLGSKKEDVRIKNAIAGLDSRYFFEATDFSLEELPSFMKRLNLYVAVDTGPIYIAHALKVPLIDIIGPVDPREQPPKDKRSIQVVAEGVEPTSFVMKRARFCTVPQWVATAQVLNAVHDLLRQER